MNLPVDPDLDLAEESTQSSRPSPFGAAPAPRRPRLRRDVLLAVFLGGCVGGWARYEITQTWPPAPVGSRGQHSQ